MGALRLGWGFWQFEISEFGCLLTFFFFFGHRQLHRARVEAEAIERSLPPALPLSPPAMVLTTGYGPRPQGQGPGQDISNDVEFAGAGARLVR